MELVENMSSTITSATTTKGEDDDVQLPGFRFHPTDEELVGFYLRRKVEKRPISIELIKQADIYKYDPWDLPKSGNVGDKEWYFFCRRGRKYKNSVRPNRVTVSGFWKATGIDKPIYSSSSNGRECVGLKKSLVYYRGSAGKGTKTEWMMHEFRLPAKITKHVDARTVANEEAEVWTLCRILKRNVSNYRKCVPDWRDMAAKKSTHTIMNQLLAKSNSETCSLESNGQSSYISFNAPKLNHDLYHNMSSSTTTPTNQKDQFPAQYFSPSVATSQPRSAAFPSYMCGDINELLKHADWEDLQSILDSANYATSTAAANPLYL